MKLRNDMAKHTAAEEMHHDGRELAIGGRKAIPRNASHAEPLQARISDGSNMGLTKRLTAPLDLGRQ